MSNTSVRVLLEKHHIEVVRVLGDDEILIKCPFHNDNRPSACVNAEKGVWLCYKGCSKGTLAQLIAEVSVIPLTEAIVLATKAKEKDSIFTPALFGESRGGPDKFEADYAACVELVPRWLLQRGFTLGNLDTFGVRFSTGRREIVYPVLDDKGEGWRIYGLIRQQVKGKPYTPFFDKTRHLFGWQHVSEDFGEGLDKLVVTEGPLDVINAYRHGITAVGVMFPFISVEQAQKIARWVSEVVLWFDADAAGQSGTERSIKTLAEMGFRVWVMDWPKGFGGRDLGSLSECEIKQMKSVRCV